MIDDGAAHFLRMFDDPEATAHYADGPRKFVPGLDALHRMSGILLAETAPLHAHVLVLGAGGGLELTALARMHPDWRFVGVDPARPMLDLAIRTMGKHSERAEMVEGFIDAAPPGPFDAGVCLLTLHFQDRGERLRTVQEIHRRLKPGAAFVAAHSGFPQSAKARERWLTRYAAYAVASGTDPADAERARAAVAANLNLFDPEQDEDIMREAGFADAELFYAAFSWRGWVGHA